MLLRLRAFDDGEDPQMKESVNVKDYTKVGDETRKIRAVKKKKKKKQVVVYSLCSGTRTGNCNFTGNTFNGGFPGN